MQAAVISEVVADYIRLDKFVLNATETRYRARCPFHSAHELTLIVNPNRNIFKCFGCGKGGDALSFVMSFTSLDTERAICVLAKRYGIPVVYKEDGSSGLGRYGFQGNS